MAIQNQSKADVQQILQLLKERVESKDAEVMKGLAAAKDQTDSSIDDAYSYLQSELAKAAAHVDGESYTEGEAFHSRNPLAGLAQAHLSTEANGVTHNDVGDALPAVVDVFGEGNPLVWAPVMVNILVEYLKPKADFKTATDEKSYIKIPNPCTIALLGDWGADNDHAQRIAQLVRERKPEIVIHLGDIYYAGNEYECERFLANWPLEARPGNSFALNGNHEMYSRGIPYFGTVLPAFGQEASYFTLYNDDWQIHGLDTAYVPFSIDGTVPSDKPGFWKRIGDQIGKILPFVNHENFDAKPDSRLQAQWDWVQKKLAKSGNRKNIFLSHNQPISAYLPEFEAGSFLQEQFWRLRMTIAGGLYIVHAWFFGHEHKGTIYDDTATEYRARLIGNGAIPHSVQALVPPQRDETNTACTPVFTMNDKALKKDLLGLHELDLAVSTFALLTLDGPDAYVEYINEDGSLFLKEKLSGKPNEVIEWGEGYGPLNKK